MAPRSGSELDKAGTLEQRRRYRRRVDRSSLSSRVCTSSRTGVSTPLIYQTFAQKVHPLLKRAQGRFRIPLLQRWREHALAVRQRRRHLLRHRYRTSKAPPPSSALVARRRRRWRRAQPTGSPEAVEAPVLMPVPLREFDFLSVVVDFVVAVHKAQPLLADASAGRGRSGTWSRRHTCLAGRNDTRWNPTHQMRRLG